MEFHASSRPSSSGRRTRQVRSHVPGYKPLLDLSPTSDVATPVPYSLVSRSTGQTLMTGSFNRTNAEGILVPDFEIEYVSTFNGWNDMNVVVGESEARYVVQVMPGAVTIIPIIVLLVVAFVTRQVLVALMLGVFLAATFINNYNPIIGFQRMLDTYMVEAIADPGHAAVTLFTFWTSAMVALIQKSGGAEGLAIAISKYAKSRYSSQWLAYVLGILIFFDDYASCLIVGNQMRPITDLYYVSHEKLAFITHTTASSPASIVPLSAWIGFELSLMASALESVGDTTDAFTTLLETIPGRFYPFFMLTIIPALLLFKCDFGPMLNAERRALNEHQLQPPNELVQGNVDEFEVSGTAQRNKKKPHWIHAVVPLAVCIAIIIITLFLTGYYYCIDHDVEVTVSTMTGNGDSYAALMFGAFLGSLVATIQYKIAGVMSFADSILTWVQGIRGIVEAVLVLIMAWSISAAIGQLGTAEWIVSALSGGGLQYQGLPSLIFILCCIMSFCTGSSWGTMALVFPLAIPLAVGLAPPDMTHTVIVDNAAAILAGSIFGDQCSPISDTSILSALSSRVSVNAHVNTQMPYAFLGAILSILVGYLPSGYHVYPSYAGLLIGMALLFPLVWLMGTKIESDKPDKFAFISKWRYPKGLPQPVEDAPYAYSVDHFDPDVKLKTEVRAMTIEEAYGNLEKFNTSISIPAGPNELIRRMTRAGTAVIDPITHVPSAEYIEEPRDTAIKFAPDPRSSGEKVRSSGDKPRTSAEGYGGVLVNGSASTLANGSVSETSAPIIEVPIEAPVAAVAPVDTAAAPTIAAAPAPAEAALPSTYTPEAGAKVWDEEKKEFVDPAELTTK
ncbi:Na+/H+ antiporter family-domain-containing protein [Hyaloraphidium curvatum]|nr:Na+/H+ antiporter family-domain-containing protein [Hyaloraphidium curvatum]